MNLLLKAALYIVLALVLSSTSFATIGMTAFNCSGLYGKPFEERIIGNSVMRKVRSRGFEIALWFPLNGNPNDPRATLFRICYKKIPTDWTPEAKGWRGAHMPLDQVQQLLADNGGKSKWTGSIQDGFKTEDGALIASLDPVSNELVIEKPSGY